MSKRRGNSILGIANLGNTIEHDLHLIRGRGAVRHVQICQDFTKFGNDIVDGNSDAGDLEFEALAEGVLGTVEVDGETRLGLAARPDERLSAVAVAAGEDEGREVVLGRDTRAGLGGSANTSTLIAVFVSSTTRGSLITVVVAVLTVAVVASLGTSLRIDGRCLGCRVASSEKSGLDLLCR